MATVGTHYGLARHLKPSQIAFYWAHFNDAKRVLDLGCGFGSLGRYKPLPEIEVFGLDLDHRLLREAAQWETVQEWDLDSGETLPFGDASFDAVLAKDILEHLQKPWLIVHEIARVLKPGGIVLASVPMPRPQVVWNDYTHIRGFSHHALRAIFEDAEFEVRRIWKMGGIPLTARLGLIRYVSLLLMFPLLDRLYATSLELEARKPLASV